MIGLRTFSKYIFVTILCIVISQFILKAQLCTGSLGDPVVNITFGDGLGTNTGYTPTNAYGYVPGGCPNDGFYSITNSSIGCFGETWHTVRSDHTGNGAFLVVNASYTPGDFIVTKVSDLCPNITYEFAAWMLNIMDRGGIAPNITFTIETESGEILKLYNTGDIPQTSRPTWKQYGFFFTTPVNNSTIVLRMKNNAPGGVGNDVAIDDITFRPCSAVKLSSSIVGASSDTVNVCEDTNNTFTVSADVAGTFISPAYQWQLSMDSGKIWTDILNATSLNYRQTLTLPGAYWYRITASESTAGNILACRINSNNSIINIHKNPIVSAGGNRIMIQGNPIELVGSGIGNNLVYSWSPIDDLSDATIVNPIASPILDITYKLTGTNRYGCFDEDEATIKVIKGIFVPNSFTPNNDGINDVWHIPNLEIYPNAKVSVYNRFGQRVYFVNGSNVQWDGSFKGKILPSGNYVFIIQFGNKFPDIKGNLLLVK